MQNAKCKIEVENVGRWRLDIPKIEVQIVGDGAPYRKCAAMHKVVGATHESPESLPCVKGGVV